MLTGQATIPDNPLSVVLVPGITVKGEWVSDFIYEGPLGDPNTFTTTSVPPGFSTLFNRRIRATWKLTWLGGGIPTLPQCIGSPPLNVDVHNQWQNVSVACISYIIPAGAGLTVNAFTVAPNPVYTDVPPATVTLSGNGFKCTYGMPLVQYFDTNGNVSAATRASACAADGTWISTPTPSLTALVSGTYLGIVSNANVSGGFDFLATVTMAVVAPTPPPPPPPPDPPPCTGGIICM